MERKTKYQYSYFIHPYIIDDKKYDKYLLKLLNDKHCLLKLWEKEKDLSLYTYFLPNIRDYLFWSFSYTKEQRDEMSRIDNYLKASILAKYPSVMFEYNLGEDIQGKVGEKNGIFFDIEKIDIVCFKTGICFILIKTIVEENKFSSVLNFNYKFRDINSCLSSLKDYENIRIQTSDLKDIKELSTVIKNITGSNNDAKDMNIEEERFLCYSYACLEQEEWNNEKDFSNLEEEFIKFCNVMPSNYQVNYSQEAYKKNIIEIFKYSKMGFTKQSAVLLTSSINPENYTKLPFKYEQEYLYTYLLALYKKIYLKKMNLEFKRTKNFKKTRDELLEFTRNIWIQEITNDIEGTIIYEKWKEVLELDYLFDEIKNKYDIVYKDLNIEKSRKTNFIIIVALLGTLIFSIINFALMLFK